MKPKLLWMMMALPTALFPTTLRSSPHWVHKADEHKIVVGEAESCPGVLGLVLSIVLRKLVGDKLPKAREEVGPKALLGKDVVVEANCSNRQRLMTRVKLHNNKLVRQKDVKPYILKLTSVVVEHKGWLHKAKQQS